MNKAIYAIVLLALMLLVTNYISIPLARYIVNNPQDERIAQLESRLERLEVEYAGIDPID